MPLTTFRALGRHYLKGGAIVSARRYAIVVACIVASLALGACGSRDKRSTAESGTDKAHWGTVAAELDSLHAAQQRLRDSLAVRAEKVRTLEDR